MTVADTQVTAQREAAAVGGESVPLPTRVRLMARLTEEVIRARVR